MSRQPHWFRTWTESPLRVVSQRSNQLVQRVRPAGEKLAGRLDCHISLSLTASDVGMKSMAGGSIRSTGQLRKLISQTFGPVGDSSAE